jgi:hypothetical protein
MRAPDHSDIRRLVESASWTGPSPRAGQSRWARTPAPRRLARPLRLAGAVAAFTVLVLASVTAAGEVASGTTASPVTTTMSHVLFGGGAEPSPAAGGLRTQPPAAAPTGSAPAVPQGARPSAPVRERETSPAPVSAPSSRPATPRPSSSPDE